MTIAWPSGLCNVGNGTLDLNFDLDFGLKTALNLRCGGITFEHVMCSV